MTKTAKRGRPAAVRSVGRPGGKAKKTSDAQRIRNILERFGVTLETAKVKAKLAQANNFLKGKSKIKFNKALDVKIAQVRSKLRAETTGVQRKTRGRLTKAEKALVESRLAKKAAKAAPAVEAPAVEPVVPEVTQEVATQPEPVVEQAQPEQVAPPAPQPEVEGVVDPGLAEAASQVA